ncbi:MAG: hypothetical protein ACUVWQ_07605 [Candidatus Aminicenantales bacterium]
MKVRKRVKIIFFDHLLNHHDIYLFASSSFTLAFSDKVISSQEEVEFPQSRWGQKAREFWTFFLQKDRPGLERFFAECLPSEKLRELSPSERARRLTELKEKLGEVALRKVNIPRPREITMVLSSSKGTFWQLGPRFELEGERLFLQGIFLKETGPDALLPPLPAMNLDQSLHQLDQEISLATAEDLLRFIQMLYEGKLISLAFTDWVFGGPEPRPGQVRNHEVVNHENWNIGLAGGAPRINAALEFEGRSGWSVIVLANIDPPAATTTARLVRAYLRAVLD